MVQYFNFRSTDAALWLFPTQGRRAWLKLQHPDIVSPAQWDVPLAAESVARIDRLVVGRLADTGPRQAGKPLTPATKEGYFTTLRAFFWDCQEWNWIPRRFN